MNTEKTRVLIIGSGPAGYTAGIYASRANLQPIIYEGNQPGGQLTQTTEIENFPGYPQGIQGPDMMEEFRTQALKFGTEIKSKTIAKVDFSKHPFECEDEDGDKIIADSVIICTGVRLNIWVWKMRISIVVSELVHVPHVTVSSIARRM